MKRLTTLELYDNYDEIKKLLDALFDDETEDLEITSDDIFKLARNGMAQVFYDKVENAVVVTEIMRSPRKCWIHILAMIGGSKAFLAFQPEFQAWALSVGATEIRGHMQAAQMRLAQRHGYEPIYTVGRLRLRSQLC